MTAKEHRKAVRHKVRFNIVYDDGISYNAGHVADVSNTGLYLESAYPLKLGTVVRLEPVDSVEDALFDIEARVVRCVELDQADRPASKGPAAGLVGIGLEFTSVDSATRDAVTIMVRELERRASDVQGVTDPYLGVRVR